MLCCIRTECPSKDVVIYILLLYCLIVFYFSINYSHVIILYWKSHFVCLAPYIKVPEEDFLTTSQSKRSHGISDLLFIIIQPLSSPAKKKKSVSSAAEDSRRCHFLSRLASLNHQCQKNPPASESPPGRVFAGAVCVCVRECVSEGGGAAAVTHSARDGAPCQAKSSLKCIICPPDPLK